MRVLTVLSAYACAAVVAVVLFIFVGVLESGANFTPSLIDLRIAGIFILAATVYASPVALPVVIVTEVQKRGNWKIFMAAGALLGVLLTILFAEVPFQWSSFRYSVMFLPIASAAALIYWAIAWKWIPPKEIASSKRAEPE